MLPMEGIVGQRVPRPDGADRHRAHCRRRAGRHHPRPHRLGVHRPHLPADFRTLPVSPQRLLVYLGLDVNGMIGAILSVAIIIVVPFTLMGQVLFAHRRLGLFRDLAMSAMGNFRAAPRRSRCSDRRSSA